MEKINKYTFSVKINIKMNYKQDDNQIKLPGIIENNYVCHSLANRIQEEIVFLNKYKFNTKNLSIVDIDSGESNAVIDIEYSTINLNDNDFWLTKRRPGYYRTSYYKDKIHGKIVLAHKFKFGIGMIDTIEMIKSKLMYSKIRKSINRDVARLASKYNFSGYCQYTDIDDAYFNEYRFYKFNNQQEKSKCQKRNK